MSRASVSAAIAFFLGLLIIALPARASEVTLPPNILVILVDDLGYGDVGYVGEASDLRTPAIDALAAEGMRFSNFYANSAVCSPTRAALLTGRYPALVGVPGTIQRIPELNMGFFDPQGPTLPGLLKSAGYTTALIGKWHLGDHLGDDRRNLPTRRGFDLFRGMIGAGGDYYTHDGKGYGWPGKNLMMHNEEVLKPEKARGHMTELLTHWANEFISGRAASSQPFFLYLAYTAPHDPIQPPPAFLKAVLDREPGIAPDRARLVALIEHLDHGIGSVIQQLKLAGKYDNTLIVFTSDNGGYRKFAANNGPFRGGKLDLHEGGIRVPAVISWPGMVVPGATSRKVVLTMDLYATLAGAAGITVDPDTVDARSILPVLMGDDSSGDSDSGRDLIFENRSTMPETRWGTYYAVRRDKWKLVQDGPGADFELYDLATDPLEQTDVAAANPLVVDSLMESLTLFQAREARVPWQPPLRFEHGVARGVSDVWQQTSLSHRYRAPVVITTPVYGPDQPPLVPRITGLSDPAVDHSSFRIRLQCADRLPCGEPSGDVAYVVFEAGVYNHAHHGMTLEALRVDPGLTDSARNWRGVSTPYVNTYAAPVLLGSIQSSNDARFSSFWSRGALATDPPLPFVLGLGKHVGEDPVRNRKKETLGYVVVESGDGQMGAERWLAGVSGAVVHGMDDLPAAEIPLRGFGSVSSVALSQMGMRGKDGSHAVLPGRDALSASGIRVVVDEDRMTDQERSHLAAEQVGYLVFGEAAEPSQH